MNAYLVFVATVIITILTLTTVTFFAVIYLGYKLHLIGKDIKRTSDYVKRNILNGLGTANESSARLLTKEEIEKFRKDNYNPDGSPHEDNHIDVSEAEARYIVMGLYEYDLMSEELFNAVDELGFVEVLRIYNSTVRSELTEESGQENLSIHTYTPKSDMPEHTSLYALLRFLNKKEDKWYPTYRSYPIPEEETKQDEDKVNDENQLIKTIDLRFNITMSDKTGGNISLEDVSVTPIEVNALGEVIKPENISFPGSGA